MISLLARMFDTERHRPRAGKVGHQIPLASEIDVVDRAIEPILVSSARGSFLTSRVSSSGCIRFGFSECTLDQEAALVREFHRVLGLSIDANGWGNRAESIPSAIAAMRARGMPSAHIIAGAWLTGDFGDNVRILDAGLPEGHAFLMASPSEAGLHTRVGDHVGILAYRVDHNFELVTP